MRLGQSTPHASRVKPTLSCLGHSKLGLVEKVCNAFAWIVDMVYPTSLSGRAQVKGLFVVRSAEGNLAKGKPGNMVFHQM